jgi:4-amino-4-deoxy-L-arabinose transferase-like glycosyltransferase
MEVRRPRAEKALVILLFAVLLAELSWAVVSDGLTIDEVVYIGAGHAHLSAGDFRLNPEQPPLAKLLGAVGLVGVKAPVGVGEGEWGYGYAFVNRSALPASTVIARSRMGNVLLTLGLALAVWAWTRSSYGPEAGLVALVLVVFHPSLLAHGHLDTTDLPGALTMFVGSWAYWAWSERPSAWRAACVGLLLGVAVATRITGWLLLPAFVLLEIRRWGRRGLLDRMDLALALALLTPLVIWASYGFRYAPAPGVQPRHYAEPPSGLPARAKRTLEAIRALPEAYIDGIEYVARHNASGHPSYLLGSTSNSGWPEYYLVAFLVKNTPGFLLGTVGLLGLLGRRRAAILSGGLEAHLLLPAGLMATLASAGHIQIGERYILPIYPYLAMLMGSLVPALLARPKGRLILGGVLAFHVIPSVAMIGRGYIPYFNILAGGPDGGYRVLVDSNLDWGQDLPRLARWMREKGVSRVQLGYHGSDNPDRFGIVRDDLPGAHLFADHPPAHPFEGTVVVSPNLVVGLFHPEADDVYTPLRARPPDDRAGVFLVYRFPPP